MRDSGSSRLIALAFWTLAVLCLLNLNDLARMWFSTERAFSALILLCCLLTLVELLRSGPREVLGSSGALILGCLGSYVGIGIVVAIVSGMELRSQGVWYLTRHVSSALVILAAAAGARALWRRRGAESVLPGLLVVLTVSCTLMLSSIWLYGVFQNPPEEGAYRYTGSFSDTAEAALVACFTIVTALALLRRGRAYILVYGALLIATIAVIGTFTRTALIGLPILVAAALFVSRGAQRKRLAGGAAIIGLLLVGPLIISDQDLLDERQAARWNSVMEIGNLSIGERVALWRLAWERALESPIYGNGLGSSHALEEAWYNHDGVLLGAHNNYLILFGEAGFIPLVLYAAFLAAAVHAGFWQRKKYWALGAVSGWALTLTIFSMTFHGLLTYRAVDFIIGVSCAMMTRCRSGEDALPETTPAS